MSSAYCYGICGLSLFGPKWEVNFNIRREMCSGQCHRSTSTIDFDSSSNMLAGSLSVSSPVVSRSSPFGDIGGSRDRGVIQSLIFPRARRSSARPCSSCSSRGLVLGSDGIGERDGLIIVDHGSRRKESNLMLNEFVAMFRDRTGYPIVEPAHMELAEPSIRDAFDICVKKGVLRVIVSPFFLFPGRHWHKDIPALTAEAARDYPGISYIITAPLGLHEQLVDVVNDRIKHCLSHVAGVAEECSVCAGTDKCRLY